MTRCVLLALSSILFATSAFAIDGQVLINQSTVMAAGGFPYRITQPGTYKLTGNLTMATTVSGNVSGIDVAIGIASSQVTLDLNGFSVFIVNNFAFPGHDYYAIAELGMFTGVAVRNGNIVATSATYLASVKAHGIYLRSSRTNRIENVTLTFDLNTSTTLGFEVGPGSTVREVINTAAFSFVGCPSVVVESVGIKNIGAFCQSSLVTDSDL